MEKIMPVQESSATALVRFTGLGIISFNKEQGRGEVAVIRDNKHTLTVRIQAPVFQDGADQDIVVYQDVATYEKLPKDDVRIEINAIGNATIEGYEIYRGGEFERLDSPDPNDFRWIVNMNTLHADTSLVSGREDRDPLTRISVSNGLFYTHKLDTKLFFEKVETDAKGDVRREVFGNVAETVGVKIEGDSVKFTIRIGDREETHMLKRVEGLPFRIEIKNMDYSDNAVYSDMPDYYKYVSPAGGDRVELVPIVEDEGAGGGSVNQIEFCHPIVVDDPEV
jgi:hypothetical protein